MAYGKEPTIRGWYPAFGTLPLRGGLSLGAGYRARLPGGRATADASVVWSFRGYRQAQAGVDLPRLGGSTIDLRTSARVRDFPRERFFGVGADSRAADRVSYRLRDADYVVTLSSRLGDSRLRVLPPAGQRVEDGGGRENGMTYIVGSGDLKSGN
ncbi:MAG: hypothetical protein HYZ58_10425 [Acidobacteria bacterium]|nr:hypothetical protein [Acidobacteriota bacterium]